MDSSDDSSLDGLVARRIVQDFGRFSIIKVPGWSTLTELEKIKTRAKVEQRQITSPQDDGALLSRLRDLTPPFDYEAVKEESRSIEDQARKDLENEGCPPCYPTHLQFPLRDIPEKYQGIISYWKSFPGTNDVVLCAQLSDWEQFRVFQRKIRQDYRYKPFSDFEEKVREGRRRHQLGGDVRLRSNSGQQSRLENWIEFQNYHLHIHEELEKERDDLKEELDVAREKAEGADAADLEHILKTAKRQLGQHKNLLRWIEQERIVMDAVHPPSVEGDHDDQDGALKAVRRPSEFNRRKRRHHAVLGEVRVSKPKPWKRKMQRWKRKAPEAEPTIGDSGPPQSSVSRNPDSRESKPRSIKKDAAPRRICPQRVSKVKRFADASAKSLPATPLRRVGQKRAPDRARPKHQQSPQRPQSAPMVVKTRSGRESRRPERWGFPDK